MDYTQAVDTLLLSDSHLSLPGHREEEIKNLIRSIKFKRLILGGDTFQYFRPKKITARQWRFLLFLENLSKEKPETEIVIITGNHDRQMIKMHNRLNLTITDEYTWSCAGRKYLAMHGHQFRHLFFDYPPRYQAAYYLFFLMRLYRGGRKKKVRVYADKLYKRTQPSRRMSRKAIFYGQARNVDSIICGHTHEPFRAATDGIEFLNSGSSYFTPSTFLTIDHRGARFHEF